MSTSRARRAVAATLVAIVGSASLAPVGVAAAATKQSSSAKKRAAREERCRKQSLAVKATFVSYRQCVKSGKAPVKPTYPTRTTPGAPVPVPTPVPTPVPGPTQTVTTPGPTTTVTAPTPAPAPEKKAKNIILMIGDGMGVTHIDAARQRYYGAAGSLNMEQLGTLGTVSTYAVEPNSAKPQYVTDSASAATAWSSGVKTYNAALGKDAFGKVVPTIMEQAKAAGMRTGNITNAEITDATPAGQMSHVSLRGCQGPVYTDAACKQPASSPLAGQGADDKTVADQIASNGTADVIMGGGLARFEPANQSEMKAAGYDVLGSFGNPALTAQTPTSQTPATKADLAKVTGANKKVIGLFNRANMTVEKYKRQNPQSAEAVNEPSVGEMTQKSIDLLTDSDQGRDKGFFLQVEGALIDKRSHANDAAQTLEEMKAFDDAVKVARDFAEKDGNTLVIVTADHECAGFNIVEKGTFTNAEANQPPLNADTTALNGDVRNKANDSTPVRAGGNAKDATRSTGPVNGAAPGGTDPKNFAPATFRTVDDAASVQDGTTDASLWLTYLSGNHTGADVKIFTYGPGSSLFQGDQDNTDLFGEMKDALAQKLG